MGDFSDLKEDFTKSRHDLKSIFHTALLNQVSRSASVGIVTGIINYFALSGGDLPGSLKAAGMIGGGLALVRSVNAYWLYRNEMERVENLEKIVGCLSAPVDKPLSRPWPWNCLPIPSQDRKEESETAQRGISPTGP